MHVSAAPSPYAAPRFDPRELAPPAAADEGKCRERKRHLVAQLPLGNTSRPADRPPHDPSACAAGVERHAGGGGADCRLPGHPGRARRGRAHVALGGARGGPGAASPAGQGQAHRRAGRGGGGGGPARRGAGGQAEEGAHSAAPRRRAH
eukprot:3844375-Prymnesium_polylepis.1